MPAPVLLGALGAIILATLIIIAFLVCSYTNAYRRCREARKDDEIQAEIIKQDTKEFYLPHQKYSVQPESLRMSPSIHKKTESPPRPIPDSSSSRYEHEHDQSSASDSSPCNDFESKFGVVRPDLYPRKDDVLLMTQKTQNAGHQRSCGRIHTKLKYDFRTSDFIVKLVAGADLPSMDIGGYSDPYVKISLEPDEERISKQSTVQRRTLNPVFDETFKFAITYDELQERTLRMRVFDFDKFCRHDAIGEVSIHIWEVNVSRQLDVWSELTLPKKGREEPGDILFSLSYLPTAERLTVVVMKARNLKAMDMNGSSDPFVKVSLLQGGRRVKKRKTSVQKHDCHPIWNEAVLFNIPAAALEDSSVELQVFDHDLLGQSEIIGQTFAGLNLPEPGHSHWQEMVQYPRKPVAIWHSLKD